MRFPPALSPAKEAALKRDTIERQAKSLTKPQHELLAMLRNGSSIGRSCLTGGQVSMAKRLVGLGLLIQRWDVPIDKRADYFITDAGRAVLVAYDDGLTMADASNMPRL